MDIRFIGFRGFGYISDRNTADSFKSLTVQSKEIVVDLTTIKKAMEFLQGDYISKSKRGKGSGIDAEFLQGKPPLAFAPALHDHYRVIGTDVLHLTPYSQPYSTQQYIHDFKNKDGTTFGRIRGVGTGADIGAFELNGDVEQYGLLTQYREYTAGVYRSYQWNTREFTSGGNSTGFVPEWYDVTANDHYALGKFSNAMTTYNLVQYVNNLAPYNGVTKDRLILMNSAGNLEISSLSASIVLYSGGALGTPSSGNLTNCTGLPVSTGISGLGTGVATWLATPSSANLLAAVTGETGTGALVFGTEPTIISGLIFSAPSDKLFEIRADTSDGTDDYILRLCGGGQPSTSRGGYIDISGNEHSTRLGRIDIIAGDVSTGTVDIYTQSLSRLHVSYNGNIVLGRQAALATNATDGFAYIPTQAGTPTGTPTAYTGKVAMTYDTTNNKLYIYNGGWKSVTLA